MPLSSPRALSLPEPVRHIPSQNMNPPERVSQCNRAMHSMDDPNTRHNISNLNRFTTKSQNQIQNEKATRQLGGLLFKGE
jgi:hypothetical protein